jgi:molybdopterin-containing oxidoreductase family iron-sulfur binding subunit
VYAPARVSTDVDPKVVAIPFGQGHHALGRHAAQRGANAFTLLGRGAPQGHFPRVRVRRTGDRQHPVHTSATRQQHDRELLRWFDLPLLGHLKPEQAPSIDLPTPEGYRREEDMYPGRLYREHRWAMVVDLQRCIGCGACAVACYAENNIVVVGPEPVSRGLEMAWLRVVPYRHPEEHRRLGFLPLPCQHCDAAPCEPVCPVFAAVHNEEGLNAQIYNRCVGTRFCSNNCPYKVRRFNWYNPRWAPPENWQLNPDVTVRSRGVMEKCTFCIQRIKRAEHQARQEGRELRDGEVQPACVQSCPTRTYVFGDLLDPKSEVSRLVRTDPRRYQLLHELNTKPAVIYLERVRTPLDEPAPAGPGGS